MDRSNQLFVTDLGSTHGSYLERNRLPANQRTLWPPNQRLIIEGFALGVIGAVGQPDTTIGSQEVKKLLDKIETENGPVMADRVLAAVRKLFNWHAARDDGFVSPIVKGMICATP